MVMEYKTIDSDLSPAQSNMIQEFREAIQREGLIKDGDPNTLETDDLTLLRFLKARNFNINNSLTMFRNCLHWRQTVLDVGLDAMYNRTDPWNYPERDMVFSKWPIWFHKLGRPINIQTFGAIDIPALYRTVSPDRHWETVLVNAESMTREVLPAASKKAGRPITNSLCIIDLKGFGLSQFWGMKSLVRSSFQVSQDYYPETMGRLLVINAPSSFTAIWSVVKPWLAKETVAKIDILGNDYKEVILGLVDEENLPVMLGGKCRCGGESAESPGGGCELSSEGPWMEERRRKKAEKEKKGEKITMNGKGWTTSSSLEIGNGVPNGQTPSEASTGSRTSMEAIERTATYGVPNETAN